MQNLITNYITKTLHDSATADGNGNTFDIIGLSAIVLQILKTGAGTTKVNFEVSIDNTNWTAIKGTKIDDGTKVSSTTASGLFHFCIGGLMKFRARISDTVGVISVTVLGIGVIVSVDELSTDIGSILGVVVKGQAIMADSLPVVLASDQNDVNVDIPNNLLGITTKGQATEANSLPVTLASDQDLLGITAKGQATMANSFPVALASDQGDINVDVPNNLLGITAKGQGTMANSLPVTLASDQGDVNVDVPNNLLGITTKGQATIANSLPVTLASDQGDINVDVPNNILGVTVKGQATMANSLPVALASDQTDINVDIPNNLLGITAKGQGTMANSLPVTLASDEADPIVTALQTIDNMISGNEAQVDVVTLPQASSVPFGTVVIALTATAQQLPTNIAKQGVIIVANELNDAANIVYLGFSNLVTNATYFKQLLPGEATPLLPVTNSNVIWVYCVFAGGTHSYNYAVF